MALLDEKPMLHHIIYRTGKANLIDKVVVATVDGDEYIPKFCSRNKIRWYCGNENDILDRIYRGAQLYEADIIVRVWGDAPLVDPEIIDKTICHHFQTKADYTYSINHPKGQNVAVVSISAL